MIAVAVILFGSGFTVLSQTATQAGPVQTYISAWCLVSLGGHMVSGIIAAENYRRMRSLGRGKARMQEAQLRLRDGQRDLKAGQAELAQGQEHLAQGQEHLAQGQLNLAAGQKELMAGQRALAQLLNRLDGRVCDGLARVEAGNKAASVTKGEIMDWLEEIGDGVQNGVSVVQEAYAVAKGPTDDLTPRRLVRSD